MPDSSGNSSNPKLDAALEYAEKLGWAVFPVKPGAKKPLTAHGFKDASKDPGQIREWWTTWPDANIGVATGQVSGITVLDCDEKPWEHKFGLSQTLQQLTEAFGLLPPTVVQTTWSGGRQIIFRYTPGAPNAAGCYGPWLDGRNDGGYIVVPPSTVADENREGTYAWLEERSPFDCTPAPMPAWLFKQAKPSGVARRRRTLTAPTSTTETIKEISGKSRNMALTSLAGSIRRRDASEETVRQALLAQNAGFDTPLAVDEVEGIVGSAMRNFTATEVEELDARYTDKANAERLAQASGHLIRYCDEASHWFYFDGVRWVRTSRYGVSPFITDLAKSLYQRAAAEPDGDKRKRLVDEARKLESARVVRNVTEMAQSLPELRITPDEFDVNEHLLNVRNGTLDLHTGDLLPRDPAHRITKLAPVDYDPEAHSSLWEDTVKLVTCGDVTLIAFLQRVLGYTLTGYTSESMFFVFYGPGGSNGKTTILESAAGMLGDYATTLRVQALLAGQDQKIPHDFADLLGARFVVTSELPKGKRYDEATLKLITGGDEVTACHKYGRNFRYYPSFKLFMSTNFPPAFSAGDDALWNRAKTVPFRFSFKTYAGADKKAKDRLKEPDHRAGILAWAMAGCREWQSAGLQLPTAVESETSQHRLDVDVIEAFLEERCELDPAFEVPVSNQELHRAYKAWAREQASPQPMTMTEFIGEMQRAGYSLLKKWGSGKKVDRWLALRLRGDRE